MSEELRRILAEMKANGVTIESRPAAGRESDFRERAAGIIEAEARALGMTFGDSSTEVEG